MSRVSRVAGHGDPSNNGDTHTKKRQLHCHEEEAQAPRLEGCNANECPCNIGTNTQILFGENTALSKNEIRVKN